MQGVPEQTDEGELSVRRGCLRGTTQQGAVIFVRSGKMTDDQASIGHVSSYAIVRD